MTTITIPEKLIKEKELIIIPRKKYEEFINLEKLLKSRIAEERDTDEAIRIFKKEQRENKLKIAYNFSEILGRPATRK
ncbi:MAG: hypothetical protein AAB958_02720 [Patescibacteria group bacterium]